MPPKPMLGEIGLTGLDHSAGLIHHDEYFVELRGRRAIQTYTKMADNDPIVGSILFALDMLMRQVTWRVEPFSESDEHIEQAEFVESCLSDMSMTWADTISEIVSLLQYGWSYHEIVYKKRKGFNFTDPEASSRYSDGKIGWAKLPIRGQQTLDRWEFEEEHGRVVGMWQQPPPDYQTRYIPIVKALHFRTRSLLDSPEGKSVLRTAYRPYYFKWRIEEIEGVGIERDLAGLPMASVDPDILSPSATPDQAAIRSRIEEIVKNVRRDAEEGILWPSLLDENGNQLYKFELLSAGGTRQFDTGAIIERYVKHIAMTVLADFILLGHEATGSFALSSSKTNLFAVAMGGWLDSIGDVFNRQGIPDLMYLNGWSVEEPPKLVHDDIESPDLASISTLIGTLINAGMPLFPDAKLEDWVRRISGMPKPDPNADPMLPAEMQQQMNQPPPDDGGDQVSEEDMAKPRTPTPKERDYPEVKGGVRKEEIEKAGAGRVWVKTTDPRYKQGGYWRKQRRGRGKKTATRVSRAPEPDSTPAAKPDYSVNKNKERTGLRQSPPEGMHWYRDSDRERLKKLKIAIPPAWTDVVVANRLDAKLQVHGFDSKGRAQPKYHPEFRASQDAKKFERIAKMSRAIPKLDAALDRDWEGSSIASAVMLVRQLGLRPGSNEDTGAEKQAYGASNLLRSQVRVTRGTAYFNFTGKSGKDLSLKTKDPKVIAVVESFLGDEGYPSDPLFGHPVVTQAEMNAYLKSVIGPEFKIKDLRTYRATSMALELVHQYKTPESEREKKAIKNEIADLVSEVLGNTRTVALNSYISPTVWQAAWGDQA